MKSFTQRRQTRFEHAWEIREAFDLRDFQSAQPEFESWVEAQVWSIGDGPTVLFDGA